MRVAFLVAGHLQLVRTHPVGSRRPAVFPPSTSWVPSRPLAILLAMMSPIKTSLPYQRQYSAAYGRYGKCSACRARNADFKQNPLLNREGHERAAKLYRMAEAAPPDRPARIEPFILYKVLILYLLHPIFQAVFLQCRLERAAPYRLGSRGRSITNAFGGSLPWPRPAPS